MAVGKRFIILLKVSSMAKITACNHKKVEHCILSCQYVLSPKYAAVLHENGVNNFKSRYKISDSHIFLRVSEIEKSRKTILQIVKI